jgi:transposase
MSCTRTKANAIAIRRQVEERGTMPNIPPKANRKWKRRFSPLLYRNRNAIERMFCRLKDFRRVATRHIEAPKTSSLPSASRGHQLLVMSLL